ncbi:GNAT family N-acetyltransferase [Aeromicrobium sp.]
MFGSPHSVARAKQVMVNVSPSRRQVKRGAIELAFLTVLYAGYSASRLLASNDFPSARGRAIELLNFEKTWRIAVEKPLNNFFGRDDLVGLLGSFWYATTHYFVTISVLIWLYRRSATQYVTARRTLVVATLIGLAFYLLIPTAPPRLIDGAYIDVLREHAQAGWWGADASAPRGFGNMTNELAAMPSLHAGWACWVALVLVRARVRPVYQHLGVLYVLITTIVIVGTGNHWVVDAVAGWMVVGVGFALVMAWEKRMPVVAHEELPHAPKVGPQIGIPRLRHWVIDDAPAVLLGLAAADPTPQRARPINTIADARRWIKDRLDDHRSGSGYNWAIETDGNVVGSVSVAVDDTDRDTGRVSYWTLPAVRGRGHASAGLRLLADRCFKELGLVRLELKHLIDNPESCRVALQAGFRIEDRDGHSVKLGAGHSDTVLHARLRTD